MTYVKFTWCQIEDDACKCGRVGRALLRCKVPMHPLRVGAIIRSMRDIADIGTPRTDPRGLPGTRDEQK